MMSLRGSVEGYAHHIRQPHSMSSRNICSSTLDRKAAAVAAACWISKAMHEKQDQDVI